MAKGYLIGEEGPLVGLVVRLEEGTEWVLGRDPDEAGIVLEDSMVSRKHVICTLTPEGFTLENLSSVNPATQNGKVVTESVLLREGDIIQIGNTYFRFTEKTPEEEEKQAPAAEEEIFEEAEDLAAFALPTKPGETRWLLKVISGPNSGAEFAVPPKSTLILGKDPNSCDLVFQDLSVSRQHARLIVDENEQVFIEDLGSRNGVLVNGEKIEAQHQLISQDLLALGTTSLLLVDRKEERETIVAAPMIFPKKEAPKEEVAEEEAEKDWKTLVISKKSLAIAGSLSVMAIAILFATFTLFKTSQLPLPEKGTYEEVQEVLEGYPDIRFSYNSMTGKLFLAGHVLTAIDKDELLYLIRRVPDVRSLEDNVVIDEYVWQSLNALLATNPEWLGISVHSASPGRFVINGYVQTLEQYQSLVDYINLHFPYLDRMDNEVVVEANLMMQIQSLLVQMGFSGVTFQLSNGEVILAGRVDEDAASKFNRSVTELKRLQGVRDVKNYVVTTTEDTSRVDLTGQFRVGGVAVQSKDNAFVLINGMIIPVGGYLEGMEITDILPETILLEKDGIKFRINYNPQ